MKVSINDVELFTLSEIQKQVIANDIDSALLHDDLARRIHYVLTHKYEQCFKRLKEEWDTKLAAKGVEMIPTNPDSYAQLVFSQPDYKSKSVRVAEEKAKREAELNQGI